MKNTLKNTTLILVGLASCILGVALSIKYWPDELVLFRALIGPFLACIGVALLFFIKD